MVACGCFSAPQESKKDGSSGYRHQDSYPEPPDVFKTDQDTRDILTRISEAIPPVDAERTMATINMNARRSTDFDHEQGPTGSSHALLAHPSHGGFMRASSIHRMDSKGSSNLLRSVSDKGCQDRGAIAHGNVWSESRKELEVAIHAEKAKDHSDWNPDLQSEEQRLRKRLAKLNLDMKVMVGDGNCQFRAVSFGLYGTQEYHRSVRQKAVEYMRQHQEDYQAFLGESVDEYLSSMQQAGTWGDELTLRAISDYWGIIINVVTSDQHNWFMRYKPPKIRILLEIVLTYIAPVHYNAIRRQTATSTLRNTLALARQNSAIDQAMKRAFSAERALVSTQLARDIREAIRSGQKLDVPTTATQGAPAVAAVSGASEAADSTTPRDSQRRNIFEKFMAPVAEGLKEDRVSAGPLTQSTDAPQPADHFHGSVPNGGAPIESLMDETFTNLLASMPESRVPISAFAAQAQGGAGMQLPLVPNGLANGTALLQPALI